MELMRYKIITPPSYDSTMSIYTDTLSFYFRYSPILFKFKTAILAPTRNYPYIMYPLHYIKTFYLHSEGTTYPIIFHEKDICIMIQTK